MLLALFIAAKAALYSLGYLTACVVNAPLLREVPERPRVGELRHLRVVRDDARVYDWQREGTA